MARETVSANDLTRNSRVVLEESELPYLVDSVADQPDGGVIVTFSSGDTAEYATTDAVTIVE
ncbi:hypothetical protein [Streptomyces sp. NPDC005244]|uniref:hypothetical protein n=1 Tax=Streptomyces sp. NPDC005244 TaxID=3364708 RepID=UPI0036BD87CE